jgi:two-component system OmpR family response regulator
MKILLVEDDDWITELLVEALVEQRYVVDSAIDGAAAWELLITFTYDLVILDLMLPKLNGVSLCQKLRRAGYTVPVLMLTAKDTSADKVTGLDVGADDYVIKPFDLPELLARVRALLRRGSTIAPPILEAGNLHLDPATCEVSYADQCISLTPKEYSLLELFLRHPRRVLRPDEILEHLWASEDPPGKETIKTHLRSVRQKLRAAGATDEIIETIYGLGYRLK